MTTFIKADLETELRACMPAEVWDAARQACADMGMSPGALPEMLMANLTRPGGVCDQLNLDPAECDAQTVALNLHLNRTMPAAVEEMADQRSFRRWLESTVGGA